MQLKPTVLLLRRHIKLILGSFLFIILFGAAFTACHKNADVADNTFDAKDAKEWYYGTFKKSAEWAASSDKGKKLPDWKHGVYKKIGNMEIVEFPLVNARTSFALEKDAALSDIDRKRIANASLSRILFIKKGSEIEVREVDYIPEWDYMQSKGFDISGASLYSGKSDFTGRVMIKKWNGIGLSTLKLKGGNLLAQAKNNARNANRGLTECGTLIIEWERYCYPVYQGDQLIGENCTEWQPTGNEWFEPYDCDDPPTCDPSSSEDCLCQLFGICDDGGGGDETNECVESFLGNPTQLSDGVQTASEVISENVSTIDAITKWKKPEWVCLKSLTWALNSREEGQVQLVDPQTNKWEWKFLNHIQGLSFVGASYGGTVTPLEDVGTPSFVAGTSNILYAGMEVKFKVKYSPVCNCPGVDLILTPYTIPYTAGAIFSAKPD